MSNPIRTDWIQSYTGRQCFPLRPDASVVCIEDIAHSLACQARFAGHTRVPLSVAQHSVFVSQHCPSDLALVGLLHDAAEAYVQDLVKPIKRSLLGDQYAQAERGWALAIGQVFDLGTQLADLPAEVKHADLVAFATEARDCFATVSPAPRRPLPEPSTRPVIPIPWYQAESLFLVAFKILSRKE